MTMKKMQATGLTEMIIPLFTLREGAEVDFRKDGLVFEIPVYFIQGEEDLLTPSELTKAYFDQIKAPKKEFILVPGAAHGHNQIVIDAQYNVAKEASNLF